MARWEKRGSQFRIAQGKRARAFFRTFKSRKAERAPNEGKKREKGSMGVPGEGER